MTEHYYRRGDHTYTVRLDRRGSNFSAEVEGVKLEGRWQELRPGYFEVELPDRSFRCFVATEGDSRYLFHDGAVYSLSSYDPREEARARRRGATGAGFGGSSSGEHLCPLAGKILKLIASEGDVVRTGTPLLIVEAMKMEHTIKAQADGTLIKFNFQPGKSVEAGMSLVEFDISPDDENKTANDDGTNAQEGAQDASH